MTVQKSQWLPLLVGLVVLVSLPLVGHLLRRSGETRCALDGFPITLIYRVAVLDQQGAVHEFCCVSCARIWLKRQNKPPQAITVTDEVSGERIDAASAWYVRSSVVTTPTTGNRVHVFRSRADAEKHAATFAGVLLPESEKPFRQFLEEG